MPPQDTGQTPEEPQIYNPLAVMQPGEQVLFELKRHPIGIIITYVMTAVMLVVLAAIGLIIAPGLIAGSAGQIKTFATIGLVLFGAGCLVLNLIATIIYWGNRWILTDDSLTQVTQSGLFHKETSQLEIESLEDVSSDQNGILAHIFNYGLLKAETAGHRSKFAFPFAPNPNYYAKQILEACEKEQLSKNGRKDGASNSSETTEEPKPGY